MLARNQELFRIFLADGGAGHLSDAEQKIAQMIAHDASYKDIATTLSLDRKDIDRTANKVRRIALREAVKRAKVAERESLIANLKATKKPLMQIPIDGLFPRHLEEALYNAQVRTLGDIVVKGRIILTQSLGVGDTGVANVQVVLRKFGVQLPD